RHGGDAGNDIWIDHSPPDHPSQGLGAQVLDLALTFHPGRVQDVSQRVANRDDCDEEPFHIRCSGGPLVVRVGVSSARTTPPVISTIPSHLCHEMWSWRRNLPKSATRTYALAVTGRTKLRSARLSRAKSQSIQIARMQIPAAVHGLANALR